MCKHTATDGTVIIPITCGPFAILDPMTGETLCCTAKQCKCSKNSKQQLRFIDAAEEGWRNAGVMRGARSEACKVECKCLVMPVTMPGHWVPRGHYVSERFGYADAGHHKADNIGGSLCPMNLLPHLAVTNVSDGNETPDIHPSWPLNAVLEELRAATLRLIPKTRSSRA